MDKSLIEKISIYGDIEYNRSFQDCTTLRIGGNADYMIYPYDINSASKILSILKDESIQVKVIGNGSNLLVSDSDYHGIVIRLNKYLNQYYFQDNMLIADAGCSIISLAYASAKNNFSGLEFASGIPASLGGCIYMNAGAYKHEIKEIIDSVCVFKDNQIIWLDNSQCNFGYRQSIFHAHKNWVILQAKIKLNTGNREEILQIMDERRSRRFTTQPLDLPSAGSVFRNPDNGMAAWQCIEKVGLRGTRIGDAMISNKHANFIVNVGHAKASDYYQLIQLIQNRVKEELGVDLIMEVEKFNW